MNCLFGWLQVFNSSYDTQIMIIYYKFYLCSHFVAYISTNLYFFQHHHLRMLLPSRGLSLLHLYRWSKYLVGLAGRIKKTLAAGGRSKTLVGWYGDSFEADRSSGKLILHGIEARGITSKGACMHACERQQASMLLDLHAGEDSSHMVTTADSSIGAPREPAI